MGGRGVRGAWAAGEIVRSVGGVFNRGFGYEWGGGVSVSVWGVFWEAGSVWFGGVGGEGLDGVGWWVLYVRFPSWNVGCWICLE